MKHKTYCVLLAVIALASVLTRGSEAQSGKAPTRQYREWRMFGGGSDNIQYSTLRQINRDNARELEVAWTYDTGDAFPGSEMQCNPVIIDDTLFATTPKLRIVALDAASGHLRWSFDPSEGNRSLGKLRNRGLTYWADGQNKRIYFAY